MVKNNMHDLIILLGLVDVIICTAGILFCIYNIKKIRGLGYGKKEEEKRC